jgi:GNAT superfamily N-acetyltransferase
MAGGRSGDERPVGYPRSYETSLQLADGRRVSVRPMLPSDAPELAEAIRTADPETLRTRFLGGPPPLTDAVLDRLTRLDYAHRFALVARDRTGRGVAVARYMAIPESAGVAEVAVVVHPAWRGVGLATKLIKMLARRALECGITQFTATFLAENRPVTELAHESHARVAIRRGVADLQVRLTAGTSAPTGQAPPINDRAPQSCRRLRC